MLVQMTGAAAYTDVAEDSWYYSDVEYVDKSGIMKGVSDETFAPSDVVTRGMLVAMFHRLDGELEVKNAESFTDVAEGAYYEAAVKWASKNKLVSGYGNGSFGPDGATKFVRIQFVK